MATKASGKPRKAAKKKSRKVSTEGAPRKARKAARKPAGERPARRAARKPARQVPKHGASDHGGPDCKACGKLHSKRQHWSHAKGAPQEHNYKVRRKQNKEKGKDAGALAQLRRVTVAARKNPIKVPRKAASKQRGKRRAAA